MSEINDKKNYKYIPSGSTQIEHRVAPKSIVPPSEQDPIWSNTDNELQDQVKKDNAALADAIRQKNQIDKEDFPDEMLVKFSYESKSATLITGTFNLINHILAQKDEEIKTVIFLDRSARLASYVFRKLWSALSKHGLIPANIKRPEIKFLNVGLNEPLKQKYPRANRLAKKIFGEELRDQKGVLIVDEVIHHGSSAMRTQEFLQKEYGINAPAISQLDGESGWYEQHSVKGIKDPNLNEATYLFMENIPEDVFTFLQENINEQKPTEYIEKLLNDCRSPDLSGYLQMYRDIYDPFFLLLLRNTLINLPEGVELADVLRYFHTAGGYLGLPPDDNARAESSRYRHYLSMMIDKIIDHISRSNS